MSNSATSSGLKTADTVIYAAPSRLIKVVLLGDGTNAASLIIYDNASAASGTILAKINLDAGLTYQDLNLMDDGVVALNGIYADVSGTGAEYIVYFVAG